MIANQNVRAVQTVPITQHGPPAILDTKNAQPRHATMTHAIAKPVPRTDAPRGITAAPVPRRRDARAVHGTATSYWGHMAPLIQRAKKVLFLAISQRAQNFPMARVTAFIQTSATMKKMAMNCGAPLAMKVFACQMMIAGCLKYVAHRRIVARCVQ